MGVLCPKLGCGSLRCNVSSYFSELIVRDSGFGNTYLKYGCGSFGAVFELSSTVAGKSDRHILLMLLEEDVSFSKFFRRIATLWQTFFLLASAPKISSIQIKIHDCALDAEFLYALLAPH
jgi:hypothetical protein